MTRLSCVEFVELITGHIEKALDRETERRFAEHITECDGCNGVPELAAVLTAVARAGRLPDLTLK